MDDRLEAFITADRVFYDVAHARRTGNAVTSGTAQAFQILDRPLPAGWDRSESDEWTVLRIREQQLPGQGWKIHVSACQDTTVDNADRVLEAVWDYCVPRQIQFKVLRSPAALLARVSKYAPRGYSGKLVTIYPVDLTTCERILRELGDVLEGEPSPYILSDLRWGSGPLYVRYGAFSSRYTVDDRGDVVPAIEDPDGSLVPDRRGPSFAPPAWVSLPEFLAPHLAARNAVTVDQMPYTVEQVLHFSNGGGVYLARDTRTGDPVVLKEARPHSGLDAHRHDAVRRLEREHEMLQLLAGIPGVPRLQDRFWLGEHLFLAIEHIDGQVLNRAIVSRYPLVDQTATPEDYRRFTDWAMTVYRRVEETITAIHERGVVYGDLHMHNLMVREDSDEVSIALLDYEVAAPVAEAIRPGLGNQGFASPRGATGFDIDRYSLACLRLALFLPMTQPLWLHRPKAHHYAEIISEHFPVPEDFLAPAVQTIAPGSYRSLQIEPDPRQWPQLRDDLVRAILASATPERDDRLFPGGIEQFRDGGGLGLAHGAAGVLYALSVTGAPRQPQLEEWLVRRATNPPQGTPPGLYHGLHGVAHVLEHLGHRQAALDTVDVCLRESWESLGPDLAGGLSGIGLNLLHLSERTGEPALRTAGRRAAELVAERVARTFATETADGPLLSNAEQGFAGLMRGGAGAALLLLRSYDDTGDTAYLDRAAEALRRDLRRCQWRDDRSLEVNEGWRTMPYLEAGSVGLGLALDEYLLRRPDEEFARASQGALAAAQSHMYILPCLFAGRAGILLYLAGRSPDPAADPLVARQVRGLAWHALPYADGIAFPGTGLLRLSMDLATGTAGVLLALGAALAADPVHAPLLAPTRPVRLPAQGPPAPTSPAAPRSTESPAPAGAGR